MVAEEEAEVAEEDMKAEPLKVKIVTLTIAIVEAVDTIEVLLEATIVVTGVMIEEAVDMIVVLLEVMTAEVEALIEVVEALIEVVEALIVVVVALIEVVEALIEVEEVMTAEDEVMTAEEEVMTVEAEVVALIGSLTIQMIKIFVAVEELNLNIKSPTLRDREVDHQWTMEIETEINSSKSFISD